MLKRLALLSGLVASVALAENETVYAPPAPASPNSGTNQGGVNFELNALYLTNYVYRGVDYNKAVDPDTQNSGKSNTDLYADAKMSFDLGPKMPHPYVAVLANIYDSDPVSKFQVFQPSAGADLTLRPVTFTVALQSSIYPKREDEETAEVFGRIALDDGRIWGSDKPVFSPYLAAAYDYVIDNGSYIEAGISHDFTFDDLHLTVTPVARLAYTMGWQQQFTFIQEEGSGWQHWDVGLEAKYSLNSLFNMSRRWGDFYLRGFVYHTEHLASGTVGQTVDWGGVGIAFNY